MRNQTKRRRNSSLEPWEISIIKTMIGTKRYNDQEILAYFTRPSRSVNHRAIGEIRTKSKHNAVGPATLVQLDNFFMIWPNIEPETGLSIWDNELLIKAREAMIAAVHIFNGAGLTFRSELFIVTSVIAWTYLLHAWFKREGIDYRYIDDGVVRKTKTGEDCYWELGKCLKDVRCPVSRGVVNNLGYLLELRHEIEHRSTSQIDETIGAYLQACCINFNDAIKKMFGAKYALERRLPIALQFVTFDSDQREMLKKASSLPGHIQTMTKAFREGLTLDEQLDTGFIYKVNYMSVTANRTSEADEVIKFIKSDSENTADDNQVTLKEIAKHRYTATKVINRIQAAGYTNFTMHAHKLLWKENDGKNPAKGFGCKGDYEKDWVWYENWVTFALEHCRKQGTKYTQARANLK